MKRPTRSFTVEVKRSRLRTGESSVTSAFSNRDALSSASVASSLSWDELLRRLPENLSLHSDQPYITSWPGQEVEPLQNETPEAQSVVDPAPFVTPQQDTQRPRVLPSLLPAEVPLDARKSAVFNQETPPLPTTRLPKQRSRLQTAELQAASAQSKSRRTQIAYGSKVTVDELKKIVQTHLKDRVVQIPEALATQPQKPAQKSQILSEEKKVLVAPMRKKAGRRRQDFWKHRLRSYAAK